MNPPARTLSQAFDQHAQSPAYGAVFCLAVTMLAVCAVLGLGWMTFAAVTAPRGTCDLGAQSAPASDLSPSSTNP